MLDGKHAWIEDGIINLSDRPVTAGSLKPEPMPGAPADPAPRPKVRPVGTH